MPERWAKKKKANNVAAGNARASTRATLLSVAATSGAIMRLTGQVRSSANESVAMTSGAAHGRESPNASDGAPDGALAALDGALRSTF